MTDLSANDNPADHVLDNAPTPESLDATPSSEAQAVSSASSEATPASPPQAITTLPTTSAPVESPAVPEIDCNEGTLDLSIRDAHGDPIPNFEFRVLDKGPVIHPTIVPPKPVEVFKGKTDAKGRAPLITGLKIGTRFEVQVKKDDGSYKLAAIGPMAAKETTACLQSPKVRFEFSTLFHKGSVGNAETTKQKTIQSHNQMPEPTPNISRNPDIKPTVKEDRDKSGNPKAIVKDGLPNMYGQHTNRIPSGSDGKTDLEKVKALIEFGMEQATWVHSNNPSALIIKQMRDGKYEKVRTKEEDESIHKCTKYVKIALWKAGYSPPEGDFAPQISLARDMGSALEAIGFKNITMQIPDARWAAPGDVIVYRKRTDTSAPGHIDIRTYDGYLSDFIAYRLPVRQFEVTGIYRKYYDPLPEKRMRAFLKVLREWECHEEKNDMARYFLMLNQLDGSRRFSNTTSHPFEGRDFKGNTPAGAYQINLITYAEFSGERYGIGKGFSPLFQDRIAVTMMEATNNALALIRMGRVEDAIQKLSSKWSSLPMGRHPRKGLRGNPDYFFSMNDVIRTYEIILASF